MADAHTLQCEKVISRPYKTALQRLRAGSRESLKGRTVHRREANLEVVMPLNGRPVKRPVEIEWGPIEPSADGVEVRIRWKAATKPQLYPQFEGRLRLQPRPESAAGLELDVAYRMPAGWLASSIDRVSLLESVESAVRDLTDVIAGHLMANATTTRARGRRSSDVAAKQQTRRSAR